MSGLVLKDDSDNQHWNQQDNEFSGIGKQSINNQSNFMVNTLSKGQQSKLSQPNLVNTSNNMFDEQNDENQFELGGNSGIESNNDGNCFGLVNNGNNESFSKGSIKNQQQNDNLPQQQVSKMSLKHSQASNNFNNQQQKYSKLSDDPFNQKGLQKNSEISGLINMNKSNNTRSQIQLNESNVSKANFNQSKSNIKNQSQIDDDNGDGLNKSSQLNNKSQKQVSQIDNFLINNESNKSFRNQNHQQSNLSQRHSLYQDQSKKNSIINESNNRINLQNSNIESQKGDNDKNTHQMNSPSNLQSDIINQSISDPFGIRKQQNQSNQQQEENFQHDQNLNINNTSHNNTNKLQTSNQSQPISQIKTLIKQDTHTNNHQILQNNYQDEQNQQKSQLKLSKISLSQKRNQLFLDNSISQKSNNNSIQQNCNNNNSKSASLIQSQKNNKFESEDSRKGESECQMLELQDYKNNFQTGQHITPILDSLQYSSDHNPQSRNFQKPHHHQQQQITTLLKQRQQTIPTPINSLQQQLMQNQRNSFIKQENHRYHQDQSTFILPELKEQSQNYKQKSFVRHSSQNDSYESVLRSEKVVINSNKNQSRNSKMHHKLNLNYRNNNDQDDKNQHNIIKKQQINNNNEDKQQKQQQKTNFQNLPTFNKNALQQNLQKFKINIFNQKQNQKQQYDQQQQNSHQQIQQQISRRSRRNSQDDDHNMGFHQSQNYQIEKLYTNRKRVQTQFNDRERQNQYIPKQKFTNKKNHQQQQQHGYSSVFQTQIFPSNISLANSKLSRIKQAKQYKKKKLQQELIKISQQIDHLTKKQTEIKQYGPSHKNFNDRLKINNNTQARQKAISLVKNLQKQRKARQNHKISSIDKIDVKISDYMSQLTKLRIQNQSKLKQKKKLEIIQRMKDKQMKRITEMKKIQASSKFVSQFMNNFERKPNNRQNVLSPNNVRQDSSPQQNNRRSKMQNHDDGLTPQLANKKAYLNRVRNLSQKKHRLDLHLNQRIDPYENKLY